MKRKAVIIISSLAVAVAAFAMAVFMKHDDLISVISQNVGMGNYGAANSSWAIHYVGFSVVEGDTPATAANVKSLPRSPYQGFSVEGQVGKNAQYFEPPVSAYLGVPESNRAYSFKKFILVDANNQSYEISKPINLRFRYGGGAYYMAENNILNIGADQTIYAVYQYNGCKVECIPVINGDENNIGGGTFVGSGLLDPDKTLKISKPVADTDAGYQLDFLKVKDTVTGEVLQIPGNDIKSEIYVHGTNSTSMSYDTDGDATHIYVCDSVKIFASFSDAMFAKTHTITVRSIPEKAMHIEISGDGGMETASADGVATAGIKTSTTKIDISIGFLREDDKWYELANNRRSPYWVDDDGSLVEWKNRQPEWVTGYSGDMGRNWSITIDQEKLKKANQALSLIYPCKREDQDPYNYAAVTKCVPFEGGTAVATIGSRTEAYGTMVTAYANEGYDFDYWSWNEGGIEKRSEERQMNVYIDGIKTYTAHFKKACYQVSVVESNPFGAGWVEGEGYYNKTEDPTTIKLHAYDDYELESCHYVTTDGITHAMSYEPGTKEADFVITEIKEDIALHVVYRSLKYKITTFPQADAEGCTSYIGNTESVGTDYEIEAKDGDKLYLKATPDNKHKFQYWKNTKGEVIKGTEKNGSFLAVITAAGTDEYTAYFNNKSNQIYLTEYPKDANIGTVSYNNETPVVSSEYTVERGSNVILKATVVDGNYAFSEWQITDSEGNELPSNASNPLSMPNYNPEKDGKYIYTAMFKPIQCIISADSTPADMGTVTIGDGKTIGGTEGSKTVDKGTKLTLTAVPNFNSSENKYYIPDYWTDEAGNSYRGEIDMILAPESTTDNPVYKIINRLQVTAVGNAKYTAHFVQAENKVTVTADPSNLGLVKFGNESFVNYGSYVATGYMSYTLSAKPIDAKYAFEKWTWEVDGSPQTSTQATFTIPKAERDMEFTAHFIPAKYTVRADKYNTSGVIGSSKAYLAVNEEPESESNTQLSVDGGSKVTFIAVPDASSEFKYWEDASGNHVLGTEESGKYKLVVDSVLADVSYKAVFVPKEVTISSAVSPAGSGTVTLASNGKIIPSGTTVSCSAPVSVTQSPNPGYTFDHWEYADFTTGKPVQSTNESLVFSEIFRDTEFKAVYRTNTHKVTFTYSAPSGITCDFYVDDVQVTDPAGTGVTVDDGASMVVRVKPSVDGYSVKQWTVTKASGGTTTYSGNGYIFNSGPISDTTEIKAELISANGILTVSAYPANAGTVQFNDETPVSSSNYLVAASDNVTLKAVESNPDYIFVGWEYIYPTSSGKQHTTSKDNPFHIARIGDSWPSGGTPEMEVIAKFDKRTHMITVKSTPLDGGTLLINGDRESLEVESGGTARLVATPSDGYILDYIKDNKGTKYQVNYILDEKTQKLIGEFNVPPVYEDVEYTGYFITMELSVSAYAAPYDAGLVDIDGSGYMASAYKETNYFDTVTLTAKPKDASNYKFERWEDDDGNIYSNNPLVIANIKESMTLTAIFVKEAEEQGIRVVASPPIGGFVSKVYNGDGTATITADANRGYKFSCWKKGNEEISRSAVTTVTDLTQGTTYTACFVKGPDYEERSDITKTHYYEEHRKVSQPVYVLTKSSLKTKAQTQILKDIAEYSDSTPASKNYSAFAHARNYFDSHKKDSEYIFVNGELTTTNGEIMPISMVNSEEDVLNKALQFSNDKFGDRYETEILAVVDVTMPEDYSDGPRTYLWRNTGAEFKDNIYLLYLTEENDDYKWETGVLDIYDDVEEKYEALRFTIPGTGRLVRIAAVRVTIIESGKE